MMIFSHSCGRHTLSSPQPLSHCKRWSTTSQRSFGFLHLNIRLRCILRDGHRLVHTGWVELKVWCTINLIHLHRSSKELNRQKPPNTQIHMWRIRRKGYDIILSYLCIYFLAYFFLTGSFELDILKSSIWNVFFCSERAHLHWWGQRPPPRQWDRDPAEFNHHTQH